jgi:hypothetical protein
MHPNIATTSALGLDNEVPNRSSSVYKVLYFWLLVCLTTEDGERGSFTKSSNNKAAKERGYGRP